jgi:hypothetical protein
VESTEQLTVAIVCFRDVKDSKWQVQIQTKNFLEEVNTLSLRKFFFLFTARLWKCLHYKLHTTLRPAYVILATAAFKHHKPVTWELEDSQYRHLVSSAFYSPCLPLTAFLPHNITPYKFSIIPVRWVAPIGIYCTRLHTEARVIVWKTSGSVLQRHGIHIDYRNWRINFSLGNTHFSPPHGPTAPNEPKPPHYRQFAITLRHTTVGRTPLDEWAARRRELWQHTTLATDRHPCCRRDSNAQPQQASGRRVTPYAARPQG